MERLVPFMVERTIILNELDHVNFVTDMTVERYYLRKQQSHCKVDDQGVWHCLLVVRQGQYTGTLVMVDELGIPSKAGLFWKRAKARPVIRSHLLLYRVNRAFRVNRRDFFSHRPADVHGVLHEPT
jgi:hypothetical protein